MYQFLSLTDLIQKTSKLSREDREVCTNYRSDDFQTVRVIKLNSYYYDTIPYKHLDYVLMLASEVSISDIGFCNKDENALL